MSPLVIPSQQRWRGYSNAAVRGWLGEWVSMWVSGFVRGCVREWVRHALPCGHDSEPCGHDSDYSFCPISFKLHMHICHDERRNPIDFGSRGQRSRSTLALCTSNLVDTIATTVFVQLLSNFTCTFTMMRGGTLLILGRGVKCQGQLWPPCEGMPRLALSSSACFTT